MIELYDIKFISHHFNVQSLYFNCEINKFPCLNPSYLCYLLSYPLVCQILNFYFKRLIQINNIFLFVTLFPFSLLHIYPSVDFFSKYLTTSSEEIFSRDTEKPFTFFMVKKGIKSNHNNLLSFHY